MNGLVNDMTNSAFNGFLSSVLLMAITLPFILISRYFYKKSNAYKQQLKDEELKQKLTEKEEIENKNLENFINLLEKEYKDKKEDQD